MGRTLMSIDPQPKSSDSTLAARGGWVDSFTTRTSSPPVYMTTAFDIESLEQLDSITGGREKGYIYTRDGNPNHEAFANDVARLEGAESGVVTSSGMGALTAVLMAMVQSGDHVLAARVLYGRTGQLLNHLAASFGLRSRTLMSPILPLCSVRSRLKQSSALLNRFRIRYWKWPICQALWQCWGRCRFLSTARLEHPA
jgi:O-acetylhomoserine/O-acetylserine sulfhydrylase-like pyridoxal-dependent enzyme